MEKIYCIECSKYRKFENPTILKIFDKTLALSLICGKCGSNNEKIIKKEESVEILTILSLIKTFADIDKEELRYLLKGFI